MLDNLRAAGHRPLVGLTTALVLLLLPTRGSATATDGNPLAEGVETLKSSSFKAKGLAVEKIAVSGDPRAEEVLQALLEGSLYLRRADKIVMIAIRLEDDGFALTNAATGAASGSGVKADLKKIIVNNKMRGAIRTALARFALQSPEVERRKAAVDDLIGKTDTATLDLFRDAMAIESESSVAVAIRTALALADLESDEQRKRLAAIEVLGNSMRSEAHNALTALLAKDDSGSTIEADAAVRKAADKAIQSIDRRRVVYGFIETAFFGLSLGFVLVLAAIGLAITFGVMGVINMAHGELMMLGAYTTWVVQQSMPNHLGLSLFVAIPAAFLVAGGVGVIIERGVVRFLYGRPLETLLATFGLSLVLQQSVRTIFSPLNRAVATPAWMSGQLVINDALAFTYNRIYIILFAILVFLALVALLRFTMLGLQVRAVAQNRAMSRAMGVRAGWVDAATFGLGAGVAGLAGVALSQLTNVGPNLGQAHIVDSFMVVVFGGVGNLWGTLVAGLTLGVANKFLEPYAGAVLAKIFVLVFIILFIQKRPSGLFPQRGRAAEA